MRCALLLGLSLLGTCAGGVESSTDRLYDGRSVEEWYRIIKTIDFESPAAAAFVPGLRAMLNDTSLRTSDRRRAALTLGRIGRPAVEAVPELIGYLDDDTSAVWAMKALALFGSEANAAGPHLTEILGDASRPEAVRMQALEPLSKLAIVYPPTVPVILRTLAAQPPDREHHSFRIALVEALAVIGPAANSALPTLVRLLDDTHEPIRRAAAFAIGRMGALGRQAAPALVDRILLDESVAVHETARDAIAAFDPPTALETALPLLRFRAPHVRRSGVDIIGSLGVRAARSRDALEPLLSDEDDTVRLAAARAWLSARGPESDAAAALLSLLGSEDRTVRKSAADVFIASITPTKSLRAALVSMSEGDDADAARAAGYVLRKWSGKAEGERG